MNNVCALWKFTECWDSSRSNGSQKKFFELLYTFKHTIEQKYALCESTVSGGLQAEAMGFRTSFSKHYTYSRIQLNKLCALWKIHWAVGFKQKQWPSEEVFQNTTNIQTYNRTKYALCESTLSGGLQAEVMAFRKSFSKRYTLSNIQLNRICTLWKYSECWASSTSKGFLKKHFETLKHYTHSNIQLNKVCILWNYTEWWASSRSNRFQRFFKTLYTFKHTIEQSMPSVKVHWVVGFKQKQWVSAEFFQNIFHIQTYNWTMYALCKSTLSGGLQAEAMGSTRIFFETLYTCKRTTEQSMRSAEVHWVFGFKQKEWLPEEIFQNILHIQTYN